MYTDFHDQNHNSISPSVVMPAVKNHIIRHSGGFELFRPNGQTPFAYFGGDDYIRESFVLTNSCGSDGIKLGSVNIGMMKVTVKNENVARIQSPDMLIDCVAYVSFNLTVDDNTSADVRYGAYFVKEVEQLTEGVKLTCYDGMCKLDAPFSGALSGTPYQILTAAATACGVRVQSTQAEIEALPNGTKTFTLHEDNDCKTWRDVLSYLSALMGCFVTFGRLTYGAMTLPGIEVRPFGGGASSFCDTITDSQRYTGAKFSLWDTAYAEFTLKAYALEDPNDPDSAKKQDFTYTDTTISTEGQTIDLGYNPFLQATTPESGLTADQIAILHDLLEKVATYQYTPMQITLPVGFIYDLGDVIKCTGRLANTGFAGGAVDDAYGVILNETYTYGRDYRIKSLDSHAGKGRAVVAPFSAMLNVLVANGTGATITATDGTHTYTATESSSRATMIIDTAGTYTVTATLNGQTGSITDTVTIDAAGTYTAEAGFDSSMFVFDSNFVELPVEVVVLGHESTWYIKDILEQDLTGVAGENGVCVGYALNNWRDLQTQTASQLFINQSVDIGYAQIRTSKEGVTPVSGIVVLLRAWICGDLREHTLRDDLSFISFDWTSAAIEESDDYPCFGYKIVNGEYVDITNDFEIDMGKRYTATTTMTLLCTLASRPYYKEYDGLAYVAWFRIIDTYDGPLLVSKTRTGATYKTYYDGDYHVFEPPVSSTFNYLGETWWYSDTAAFMGGTNANSDGIAKYIGSFNTAEDAARHLIDVLFNNQ